MCWLELITCLARVFIFPFIPAETWAMIGELPEQEAERFVWIGTAFFGNATSCSVQLHRERTMANFLRTWDVRFVYRVNVWDIY